MRARIHHRKIAGSSASFVFLVMLMGATQLAETITSLLLQELRESGGETRTILAANG